MEKISCICKMRQLYQAICRLETDLVELYGVTLNEAMVMCCIGHEQPAAKEIAQSVGMKVAHLSKVLRSIEEKGFVNREFGDADRRLMCFSLTEPALSLLGWIRCDGLPVPELLRDFFAEHH